MIARSAMALYALVEGLIEKAVVPLCNGQWPGGKGGGNASQPDCAVRPAAPAPPPKPMGEWELLPAVRAGSYRSRSTKFSRKVDFASNPGSAPVKTESASTWE